MKNRITVIAVIIVSLFLAVAFFAPTPEVKAQNDTVTEISENENALKSRFLNMLNHNSSYNEDFESVDMLVNNAVLQNLDLRDGADEDFIKEIYISDYMKNMYGIEISETEDLNPEFPQKDGYIFIIPRGYDVYAHEFVSMRENEDGTVSVETAVTLNPHDGEKETYTAVSLFVKNEQSAFGWNLVYSNIIFNRSSV